MASAGHQTAVGVPHITQTFAETTHGGWDYWFTRDFSSSDRCLYDSYLNIQQPTGPQHWGCWKWLLLNVFVLWKYRSRSGWCDQGIMAVRLTNTRIQRTDGALSESIISHLLTHICCTSVPPGRGTLLCCTPEGFFTFLSLRLRLFLGEFLLNRCEGPGKEDVVCTDYKALWGIFEILGYTKLIELNPQNLLVEVHNMYSSHTVPRPFLTQCVLFIFTDHFM